MNGLGERKAVMRRPTVRSLLVLSLCAGASTGCVYRAQLTPKLPQYRLAILLHRVGGQCRTTTVPAFAVVSTTQTVAWDVVVVDGNCQAADVKVALKPGGGGPDKPRPFEPRREGNTISVRGLAKGRYQYNVTVGNYTEDPELEVWR
jgi:hypothetical protein